MSDLGIKIGRTSVSSFHPLFFPFPLLVEEVYGSNRVPGGFFFSFFRCFLHPS